MVPDIPVPFVALVVFAVVAVVGSRTEFDPDRAIETLPYAERLRPVLQRGRASAVSVRALAAGMGDRLARHPILMTVVLAGLLQAYAAYRLFGSLPAGTWPVLGDSMIFEYIGWYLSEGNRLYVDVWEVKPPLAFEITTIFALVAGDNVVAYHALNVLATVAALLAGAAAAAGIVHELTEDPLAAVTAGLVTFVLPRYFFRALIGFKSKYFVIAAGLGCLYLAYRERPGTAGVAGAAAVGFWQLAVVFPVAALGLCWQAKGRAGARRYVIFGVGAGVVMLLPVVIWGAIPAMFAEAVLTPLLMESTKTFTERVHLFVRVLGRALPIALIGVAGVASGLRPDRIRQEWPIVLVAGWFTFQVLGLDFDNSPDLFPWLAVIGIGVGFAVAAGRRVEWPRPESGDLAVDGEAVRSTGSQALAVGIILFATLSVVTMGGFGSGSTGLTSPQTYDTSTELTPDFGGATTYNATENQYIYWNRVEIPTCRALGSYTQFQLVNRLGIAENEPWYDAECGQFGPAWRTWLASE